MKTISKTLLLLSFVFYFSSCEKDDQIGPYGVAPEQKDTTSVLDTYTHAGSTPNSNWTNQQIDNSIKGTVWVLFEVSQGYVRTPKSDTLNFITNTKYTLNSDTTKHIYSLYSTMGNSTITFNRFDPINGLYLSANNFYESVFETTPVNGTILLNLKDNLSNNSETYKSEFKKIKN
jgi:hypothetical protein